MNKALFLLLAAFPLLAGGCSHTEWVRKDFNSVKTAIDTVSVIFPQIDYYVKYGATAKTKRGYSLFVSNNVADVVKGIIDEGKFGPHVAILVEDSVVIDQWILSYLSHSMEGFSSRWDSAQTSPSEEKLLPLTPEMKSALDRVNTRYFVFVTGTAYGTSNDKKIFDMIQSETFKLLYDRSFAYDYQWNGLRLQIFLVDKKTDEILWYNYNRERDSQYNPLEKQEIYSLCLKMMEQ
ncbi:MAG TPA: hypothetical protein VMM58_12595 [Bacteroidota bacterium]|nr:hypothetical protein [Bacteroidota bacterium]